MKDLNENFAAIAVIGDLYESGKDMYDVLAAYLQIVIASEKMNGFTSVDITDRINRTNSFRVNESIVKTALKRLELERDHGVYYVTKDTPHSINTKELNEQIQQNRLIVDQLCSFIQSELKQSLSDEERESIQKQFYNYLMSPEREDTYSVYISQFVMNHCLDTVFQDVISRI